MSRRNRTQLDRLLRRWAATRQPSEAALAQLQRQILARWMEQFAPGADDDSVMADQIATRSARRWWLATAALAAVVALVAGGLTIFWSADREVPLGRVEGVLPATVTSLPREPRAVLGSVFAEAERLFGGQLAWVADTPDHLHLGLIDDGVASQQRQAVAVRVMVMRRTAAHSAWAAAWWVEVMCRPQEVVRIRRSAQLGDLYLWACLAPDGMVAVDTYLVVDSPVPIRASQSDLYRPGVPKVLAETRDSDGGYRVVQTVAVVDPNRRDGAG